MSRRPPSDLVSTLIARPLCNCLVKKINQGTDVFTHQHTELPASSFSNVPCTFIYIDRQFFIITKPQDKSSLNWPVGSGHLRLGLQIYFSIISEKAERIDCGHGKRVGGEGGGGYVNKMGYIYIIYIY